MLRESMIGGYPWSNLMGADPVTTLNLNHIFFDFILGHPVPPLLSLLGFQNTDQTTKRVHAHKMNFSKIGVQGFSLGSLQLTTDELIWTSADKSRQDKFKL